MGQCSTLPAEARGPSPTGSTRHDASTFQRKDPMQEQKQRLRDEGRKESLDFNQIVTPEQPATEERVVKEHGVKRSGAPFSNTSTQPEANDYENTHPASVRSQTRGSERLRAPSGEPEAMDVDPREEAPAPSPPPPPPPDNALKIRAYKLNLESEFIGLSSSQRQQLCLGPFAEPPPFLTYSSSEDSIQAPDAFSVAIQTAQIFRGITVSRDGTILTQNARATRSNRGSKTKRGEKSRQAAKIDKANDLVEEHMASGKTSGSDEVNNMVSVFIVGEYDDMKQLVRDGSRKLKEAEGLPDEALLAVNRPRAQKQKPPASSSTTSVLLSPRKRASPNFVNSQRDAAMQSPEKVQVTAPVTQSAPPRLKSHPRDTRPMRREDRSGTRMRFDATCNDMLDPRSAGGGVAGDGDWSHAWNIWNCGGVGTVSPVQTSSPKDTAMTPLFEGRDANTGNNVRDAGIDKRAN
jgi:hypothetical protein